MCSAALAKSPFDGTWRLNVGKSQLTGDTMRFEDGGNGTLKYTDSTESYTFEPDGSSFKTPIGDEEAYQKTSNNGYTHTIRRSGLLLVTEAWKLSPDGNTVVIESKGTRPNGDTFDDYETFVRTSAGTGLVGRWKSTRVKATAPNTLTIQTAEKNDVTLTISAAKATVQGQWNGRDYPYRGPTVPVGATLALSKTGARGFKAVMKLNGRVVQTLRFSVAADGQSMVNEGTDDHGKKLPFRQVWDKQS
jgi:hypothetical protein